MSYGSFTRVTDRRTELRWLRRARAELLSHVKTDAPVTPVLEDGHTKFSLSMLYSFRVRSLHETDRQTSGQTSVKRRFDSRFDADRQMNGNTRIAAQQDGAKHHRLQLVT